MNERIYDIEKQAWEFVDKTWNWANANNPSQATLFKTKFAELIVQECIKTIEYRAPGQMGKEGEGWRNGYDDGLKTGAWLLKEHFGVES